MSTFGERLKIARKAKGMTQDALADKINICRQKISYIENDIPNRTFTITELKLIAETLDISIDYLLNTNVPIISISFEIYQNLMKELEEKTNIINNIQNLLRGTQL